MYVFIIYQLSVNMKTVHFGKILLAQAGRAY